MKRLYYLDTLKVMLTILVVFHHAAEAYSPYSAWVYKPSNKDEMMPLIEAPNPPPFPRSGEGSMIV